MTDYKKILSNNNNFEKYHKVESKLLYESWSGSNNPVITIAIPTYKRELEMIEAVESAIKQNKSGLEYEIIIVDNNPSTQPSKHVMDYLSQIKDCPASIKYYKNNVNIGMFGNWNRCVELARGEWIAFLHDDDQLEPNYISNISREILNNKDIGGICSNTKYFGSGYIQTSQNSTKIKRLKSNIKELFAHKLLKISPIDSIILNSNPYGEPSCGLILRKSYVEKLGGFDESFGPVSDWFFLFKFNLSYKIYKPQFVTGSYRWEMNESLNINTIHGFMNGFEIMRKFGSEFCTIGVLLYKNFRVEQHLLKIDELKDIIHIAGGDEHSFDYIYSSKHKSLKLYIYKYTCCIYRRLKYIISIIS